MIDEERAKGPTLVVDSGNALFRMPTPTDEAAKERARFILRTMGALGTQAMAAGARDLAAGADFLKAEADRAHVKVLSANLTGADHKLVFPASAVVNVGGVRVGLVGVTAAGTSGALPPVPAALEEAAKVRPKADLVVVLGAIAYADALQLSTQGGDKIDFVLQSHEARGTGIAQKQGEVFVMPSGERGRAVGRLVLSVAGKGAFTDLTEIERNKQAIKSLEAQVAEVKKRSDAATDPAVKKQLLETMKSFEGRQKELAGAVAAATAKGGRTFALDYASLGNEVKDDPDLKAQVAKIEPTPAAH